MIRAFASILLVDRRGRVLLQERDAHPVIDPDRWGFCGGHVEPGETYLQAAYRELEEETGIALSSGLELWRETRVHHVAYGTDDPVAVFTAGTGLGDADIDCREGRQIRFVDAAELDGLDLAAAAEQLLPEFLASERYASLCARGAAR